MENAAKALLISASVLIAVMLLSLIFIFKDQVSSYFTAKHEATINKQINEFNNSFQKYNGKTIRGNELISIMNKIVDYNNYQSEMEGYKRINFKVDFKGHKSELLYNNETGSNCLIDSDEITNSTNDDSIKRISTTSSRLVNDLNIKLGSNIVTDVKLQKMSSNIDKIVDDSDQDSRNALLKNLFGTSINLGNSSVIQKIKNATYQYYQFTMLKGAMFKCTKIGYDTVTGRVDKMEFEVILESDKIKFD